MRESRASQPTVHRPSTGQPVVTYALVGINVVLYLFQQFIPGFTAALWFAPAYVQSVGYFEPWRMITSMFLHGSLWHILFNMYALYLFGSILERGLGRGRYLALYLISGFAGSVAVLLLSPPLVPVVGASGAIFGLFGAFIVLQKQMGGSIRGLLILLGINIVIAFLPGSNIGALLGFILGRTRRRDQQNRQKLLFSGIAIALVLLTIGAAVLA
jgi:membrane associated rhomboid family serine protease